MSAVFLFFKIFNYDFVTRTYFIRIATSNAVMDRRQT